jgi:phosphohistidine phosphatase
MLRLLILRHANTGWALPGQKDIDRELNEQGIEDLAIIRKWISAKKLTPDQIYCSPAARTKATLEGIAKSFSQVPRIDFVTSFYSGFVSEYISTIHDHTLPETIMLIGHNPTCASLANMLIEKTDANALSPISYTYPAGSLAIIDFDINHWIEMREGKGKLVEFLVPHPNERY